MIGRRKFLQSSMALLSGLWSVQVSARTAVPKRSIITVKGPIPAKQMGVSLIHEHILVDFVGADKTNSARWNIEAVAERVRPLLSEVKQAGCSTFVDCTPNYLGRDVMLLRKLSVETGLAIITNTGYYGGSNHKFLPPQFFKEEPEQLAARWINEFEQGIDGTDIKPGFIKISVNTESLSPESQKLIRTAAITHLRTGLTIASHTGPAVPAFEQLEILNKLGIDGSAFIWVHAQNEPDKSTYRKAIEKNAWVSLDGLNDDNVSDYVEGLRELKNQKLLHRVLVSHDAGWYDPEKANGGDIRGYMTMFNALVPKLREAGFSMDDIRQLLEANPQQAFTINVRRLKR